jgi:hypothetical protein
MAWVGLFGSVVAVVQGVAWLGPRRLAPRPFAGGSLATAGVVLLGLSLLHLAVPGFWGD